MIHRDIKPHNFLIGFDDPNVIYLTEFRFCTKYRSSKTGKHIKHDLRGTFTGGLLYSSANAQRGMQQSRKDDLESLGYVLLYLFKGKLPWDLENLENIDLMNLNEKDIYLKIYRMKKFMPIEKLCKDCPSELEEFIKYIRKCKFKNPRIFVYFFINYALFFCSLERCKLGEDICILKLKWMKIFFLRKRLK